MKRCQDYTEGMEKSKVQRLSISERIGIRFHLAICPTCRKYFNDSEQLDKWLTKRFKDRTINESFTREEKESLKARLRG